MIHLDMAKPGDFTASASGLTPAIDGPEALPVNLFFVQVIIVDM